MATSSSFLFLPFLLPLSFLLFSCSSSSEQPNMKVVDFGNQVLHFLPSRLVLDSAQDAKDVISCERVQIAGISRFKISRYASSFLLTLKPSDAVPERLWRKISVCFHRNESIGLCQCTKDEWETLQEGQWSSAMSPYDDRYVDVKFADEVSGSVTIFLKEEFQQWRLFGLCFGFVLLLFAPLVSSWVPFYYSSSMALGVLLIVLVILFQGMKFLPTGRKNVFYLTMYGSVLGAGSFFVHYFSLLVNSILGNFGLNEDMYTPVSVFVVLAIFIGGAAVGCWIVRKFVLSEDGSVDAGTAQFVKWAMRVIAIVSILLSTSDTALKIAALCCCWGASFLLKFRNWQGETSKQLVCSTKRSLWQPKVKHAHRSLVRPEFLSRPPRMAPWRTGLDNKGSPHSWSKSPTKGLVISSPCKRSSLWESEFDHEDYYSTFHKTPVRKRFSKRDWEDFTRESTKDAMAKLASSPEFTDWVIEHSDRIQVLPDDSSDDGSMGSRSDSSEETAAEGNGSGLSFFKWY